MNWEAIGAIGELISALAVIATLIYLAIQIRHSSEQSWSQNVNSASAQLQKIFELQTNPNVAEALEKASTDQKISVRHGIYLEAYIVAAFVAYEAQFNHYRKGINIPSWENRRKSLSHFLVIPWMAEWWNDFGQHTFDPEFVREVQIILKENPGDKDYMQRINANDT